MTPAIAAIIIGIDGWQRFTLPLIESIRKHEPSCRIAVVDNYSMPWYPETEDSQVSIHHVKRLSYSAAINYGKNVMIGDADWCVVLSNDVLCTAPFAHVLEGYGDDNVVGPLLKQINIERVGAVDYIEGWCVAISRRAWDELQGWDEGMQISSYEDCDFSHRARKAGFWLVEDLPFVHLDQKQRFYLVPDYWDSEYHNRARFIEKHRVTA